jgi:hypothetical protein
MALHSSPLPPTHHLMRVRVRTRIFERLRVIADEESKLTGDHTSVSDLVRAALSDWISVEMSASYPLVRRVLQTSGG